ncbi:MAG: metal-dependent hydrolase [Flavobacteriaceae bacterium]
MASIFGHSIVAFTITKVLDNNQSRLLILLAIISDILPDLDVISFNFGIPYDHPLGHRGFTHSILFALIWSVLITYTFGKANKRLWISVIFLSTFSHGILDAMTSGGRGVGFFIPFNNDRFFFPFREIVVSPLGVDRFFSDWGFQVILSELKYIFLPCVFVLVILHVFNNKLK